MASKPRLRAVPDTNEMAALVLTMIDQLHILRNHVAAALNVKPGNVNLGIAKDGIAFDVSIKLTANEDAQRLIYTLEANPVPGVAFIAVQKRPALGKEPHRITARVVSPEQIV